MATNRLNRADINQLFNVIHKMNPDTSLDKHAGGWRLVTADGGTNISPRLQAREFYWWLHAYEAGLRFNHAADQLLERSL